MKFIENIEVIKHEDITKNTRFEVRLMFSGNRFHSFEIGYGDGFLSISNTLFLVSRDIFFDENLK